MRRVPRRIATVAFALAIAGWARTASADGQIDADVKQWFTGPLIAPSPALPVARLLAVEPYVIYSDTTGAFGANGGRTSRPHAANHSLFVFAIKYAITKRLTVAITPSLAYQTNGALPVGAIGVGDLPVELEYRFKNGNGKTGSPSVTFDLGVTTPIGAYQQLANPLDGIGSGASTLKEGVVVQSLFNTASNHAMRVRLWAAVSEPLRDVTVRDLSVYGTLAGFRGSVTPGISRALGLGMEYGLDRRWVIALDLSQNYANAFRLRGIDAKGSVVRSTSTYGDSFVLAPAIEYNMSGRLGIIGGVAFSAAGRNASSFVAPQVALSMAF